MSQRESSAPASSAHVHSDVATIRDAVLVVSPLASVRVGLTRWLSVSSLTPLAVGNWKRAVKRLDQAAVIVTDVEGLEAAGADVAILGLVPDWLPVLAVRGSHKVPSWASHRVRIAARTDLPDMLDRIARQTS